MNLISDSIQNDLKPFDIHENIVDVQDFFALENFSHFPVLADGVYIGSMAASNVDGFDIDKKIENYKYTLDGFFARESNLWIDVLQVFAKNNSNIIPVLNTENQYLGYYQLENIQRFFGETPFLSNAGNVIIVEKDVLNYSMSQVVQIIESSGAQLLGCFVSENSSTTVQITIKIGLSGINEILQAFRRYDYEIVSTHEEDVFIHNLRERSEYLEKYLSV
jgi:hypothetical protein